MHTNTNRKILVLACWFSNVNKVFVFQGNKRLAVEDGSDSASSSSCLAGKHLEGRSLPLKARYGVNAWKRWASSPSDQSDDTKVNDSSKPGNCLVYFLHWHSVIVWAQVLRCLWKTCTVFGWQRSACFSSCCSLKKQLVVAESWGAKCGSVPVCEGGVQA